MLANLLANLTVRSALDSDAVVIQSVVEACFDQYAELGLVFDLEEMPDLIHPLTSLVYDPPRKVGLFRVATLQNNIIATVAAQAIDKDCEIKRLYVLPKFQNYGIGAFITLDIMKKFRHKNLFLWSDSRFTNAHKLYQKLGFSCHKSETRTLNDKSCSKELLFVKPLRPPKT